MSAAGISYSPSLTRKGSGRSRSASSLPAGNMQILDFMQKRFTTRVQVIFENMFLKAKGSKTRKGLRQKKKQERTYAGLFWFTEK